MRIFLQRGGSDIFRSRSIPQYFTEWNLHEMVDFINVKQVEDLEKAYIKNSKIDHLFMLLEAVTCHSPTTTQLSIYRVV